MISQILKRIWGVQILAPQIRSLIAPHYHCKIHKIRLYSSTSDTKVPNGSEKDTDLLFDLGGINAINAENGGSTKTKVPKSKKNDSVELESKHLVGKPNEAAKKLDLPKEKKKRTFEQLKYHDVSLNLTYIKLPFEHPEFSQLMLRLKSRKYRAKDNLLLIEGRRLTLDAIDAGLKIQYMIFSNTKQVEEIRNKLDDAFTQKSTIFRVPHNDLSFWSTLMTCPGLITVFEKPKDMDSVWRNVKTTLHTAVDESGEEIFENKEENLIKSNQTLNDLPITLICDQIREPNNLGAIIRSCAALPCAKVILLKGCTDPWDVKALRGGCGSQFRVPIIGPIEWEELGQYLPPAKELSVFVADTKVNSPIPIAQPWDDFEHSRKQNNIKRFKAKPYSSITFSKCKNIALIVGGETEGVSSHAIDFMHAVAKQRLESKTDAGDQNNESFESQIDDIPENSIVQIPLGNGVESLNATIATSILLFEMRKQLIGV